MANNLINRVGMDMKNFSQGTKKLTGEFATISRAAQRASGGISKSTGSMLTKQSSSLGMVVGGFRAWQLAAVTASFAVAQATRETMLVDAALGQLNFLLGENAQAFEDWADANASAFGMAKSEAVRFGAVYANLVSVFATDTEDAQLKTQELLKSSAIVASASGRTMTDVMERIRSGMLGNTEAVEDLGVNVQANALQETKAFKTMANGAKNWDSITSQTLKQQIRYYAILEQVQNRFGTSMRDNVSTRMLMFQSELKNVSTNIGGMFIPLLYAILPPLTALVQKIAFGAKVVAQFMTALFGYNPKNLVKTTNDQADAIGAMGDSAEEAGKKAKGALAGFDEINSLSQADAGGGGGADVSAGAGIGSMDTGGGDAKLFEASAKIQEAADKIRASLEKVGEWFTKNKDTILVTTGIVTGFFAAWKVMELMAFIQTSGGVVKALQGLTFWSLASQKAQLASKLETIALTALYAKDFIVSIWNSIKALGAKTLAVIANTGAMIANKIQLLAIGAIMTGQMAVAFAKSAAMWVLNTAKTVASTVATVAFTVATTAASVATWALNAAIAVLTSPITLVIVAIGALVLGIIALVKNWDKVKETASNVWSYVKGIWAKVSDWFTENVTTPFENAWESAFNKVKKVAKSVFDGLVDVVKRPINTMIDGINALFSGLNKLGGLGGKALKALGIDFEIKSIPSIPKLARGGIVDSPTIAQVGEAGKEMVVPLENTSFVDKLASALGTAVLTAMQTNGGSNVGGQQIVLDGVTLAKAIAPYTSKESARLGSSMIVARG